MKKFYKKWSLFGMLTLMTLSLNQGMAQVSSYGFSPLSGSYTPLVSPTATSLTATADDAISTAFPIGFNFTFNGIVYTQLMASSNGQLLFGTGRTQSATNNLATTTATQRPGLAPLWDDLQCTSGVTYQLNGTAPNQTLTVQWSNMEWNYASGTGVISFQVILYETSNVIDFIYREEATAVNVGSTGGASIGLMGVTTTDFLSLQNSSAAPTISTATSTNNISVKPATGQIYRFGPPPATPPTPTQDAATTDCINGTNLIVAGSPGAGVTWYWQSSPTGTSTATPYSGPYNVLSNGTYYLRAFHAGFNVWSLSSSSYTVSDFPSAALPPVPTADANPACLTTNINMPAAPIGIEYYWQGTTVNGTSTANPATTPFLVSASGTYTVSAYDTGSQCWSNTESIAVTIQTTVPTTPTTPTANHNICGGLSVYDIEANATYAVSQSFNLGSNLNSPGTLVSFPTAIPALPAGAVVTSASLVLTDVNSVNGSWRSEIRVSLSDMYSLAPTQISTSGSSGLVTPNPYTINLTGFPATGGNLNLELNESFNDAGATIDATFGSVQLVINYTLPATINWFDAASNGTNIGTGSIWDCIGNAVMADPSSNGTYEFYAESQYNACTSAGRTLVTVDVLNVNVLIAGIDESCLGYNDGSFVVTDTLCGNVPFLYSVDGAPSSATIPTDLGPGTYSIVIEDNLGNFSNPIMVTVGTTNTAFPTVPTSVEDSYSICSGISSHFIEAESAYPGSFAVSSGAISLAIPDNNAAGGITSNLTVAGIPGTATITNITVGLNITHTFDGDLDIYLTGANGTQIELSTDNGGTGDNYVNTQFSLNAVTLITSGAAPFTGTFLPEGNLNSLLTGLINGTWTLLVADDAGGDLGTLTNWSINIEYTIPANINWFDAASAGTNQGSGSPFESVGTALLADPTTNGTYEFYAEGEMNGCLSTSRSLVTIVVNDVNVELLAIDATCNNQANGSFEVVDTLCGITPFTYSINGGAFGTLPTDLLPGTYTVQVMDDNGNTSLDYTIVVGDALPPSLTYMETITDNGGQVSWTANGSETQWYVEWGLPGFTPGTGTELGSADAMDTFWIITGLNDNTNYDVYVSANCGASETVGAWDMVNFTTDCAVFTVPFNETFENSSSSRICWTNEQVVGAADWTYQTGSSGGLVTTAYEGAINARFVSENNDNAPITKLVSPRFDFTGQDSVALVFAYAQEFWNPDQNITKVYVASQTSGWTEIQSYNNNVATWTLDTLFLSDTVYQFAFEGINNWGRANVIDDVRILPCNLIPGTDGSIDVCRTDATVDLNSIIVKGEEGGRWVFQNQTFIANDSIAQIGLLPAGTHEFYYIVETPCAKDTTVAYLTVFNASSAGNDATITVCRNEPFNLLAALTGQVDHGGTWYDPANNPMASSQIMASNIPGQYNYDYIVSNGVCGPDTANVVVNVSPSCDWLNIAELGLEAIELYPNPTSGMIYITNEGSTEVFSYEVTDLKGKVIAFEANTINGTDITPVDLSKLEPGVYLIKVANEKVEHTFRVIKQ